MEEGGKRLAASRVDGGRAWYGGQVGVVALMRELRERKTRAERWSLSFGCLETDGDGFEMHETDDGQVCSEVRGSERGDDLGAEVGRQARLAPAQCEIEASHPTRRRKLP